MGLKLLKQATDSINLSITTKNYLWAPKLNIIFLEQPRKFWADGGPGAIYVSSTDSTRAQRSHMHTMKALIRLYVQADLNLAGYRHYKTDFLVTGVQI